MKDSYGLPILKGTEKAISFYKNRPTRSPLIDIDNPRRIVYGRLLIGGYHYK